MERMGLTVFVLTVVVIGIQSVSMAIDDNVPPINSEVQSSAVSALPVSNVFFTFSVLGNTRTYYNIYSKLEENLLLKKPDFVFNTGDLVNTSNNDNEWLQFNRASKRLFEETKYYAVPGHNDITSLDYYRLFKTKRSEPYSAISFKNTLFILLNSNNLMENDPQYQWLLKTLTDASMFSHIFLFLHEPLFTSDGANTENDFAKMLRPLIDKYHIEMVFSGHRAAYERTTISNVQYIVTGGGGAPLETFDKIQGKTQTESSHHFVTVVVSNKQYRANVENIDGKVIDSFTSIK